MKDREACICQSHTVQYRARQLRRIYGEPNAPAFRARFPEKGDFERACRRCPFHFPACLLPNDSPPVKGVFRGAFDGWGVMGSCNAGIVFSDGRGEIEPFVGCRLASIDDIKASIGAQAAALKTESVLDAMGTPLTEAAKERVDELQAAADAKAHVAETVEEARIMYERDCKAFGFCVCKGGGRCRYGVPK